MKEERKLKIEDNSTPSYFKSKDLNKNPETKTSFTVEEIPRIYSPTMNLRWFENFCLSGETVLQQQWVNNIGEVEWREIPTV